MTQKVNDIQKKGGLLKRANELVFNHAIQDHLGVNPVFLDAGRPKYNVVQVDVAENPNKIMQSCNHASLVSWGGIAKPHRHHKPLVKPKRCCHCCVWNVVGVDFSLKKGISHVNLAPNPPL